MPRYLVLLLLITCFQLLAAQTLPYQDRIERSRMILTYDPSDTNERLNLAYYLMLAGMYADAAREYQAVLDDQPHNMDAAAGELWALSSQGMWSQVNFLASTRLAGMPNAGVIRYHLANAQLALGKPLHARSSYAKALAMLPDGDTSSYSRMGIARSYQAIGDVPRALHQINAIPPQQAGLGSTLISQQLRKPSLGFDISFASKSGNVSSYQSGVSFRRGTLSGRMSYEALYTNGDRYHDAYALSISQQTRYLDVAVGGQILNARDIRIGKANQGNLAFSPKLYIGAIRIDPGVKLCVTMLDNFNVYQTDTGFTLRSDPVTIAYAYSHIYQDNDSPGADRQKHAQSLSAISRVWHSLYGGLYAGMGDFAFHTNSSGTFMDDFDAIDGYLGISLHAPLINKLFVTLYTQYGSANDEPVYYSSAKLSYSL